MLKGIHRPTLIKAVVVFAVLFVAYHLIMRRNSSKGATS